MTFELLLASFGCVFAAVGAVAALAGLNDAGRQRLSRWTRATANGARRVFLPSFAVLSVVNGCVGVISFGIDAAPLTRSHILWLLVYAGNVGAGIWILNKIADQRLAKRAELEKLL